MMLSLHPDNVWKTIQSTIFFIAIAFRHLQLSMRNENETTYNFITGNLN